MDSHRSGSNSPIYSPSEEVIFFKVNKCVPISQMEERLRYHKEKHRYPLGT